MAYIGGGKIVLNKLFILFEFGILFTADIGISYLTISICVDHIDADQLVAQQRTRCRLVQ